ncbi:MAG TPA: thiamine biosynthesis protein ThiS [Planctomycetaceae bacterium]|jgi:thiamine biosynthesis protein ThiS|nr:thiamine biosynthesis protein ThiS [Planctomycetaceae bacterium]
MHITLNGAPRDVPEASTIADLLQDLQIESRYCAVERNRHVVPRETHSHVQLQAGDEVEIVTLVGGG